MTNSETNTISPQPLTKILAKLVISGGVFIGRLLTVSDGWMLFHKTNG
jgi:hypothetical protein